MPITNPAISVQIASYCHPSLKARMRRIRNAKPRYSFSIQIERCLESGLPALEREVGLVPLTTQK